MHLFQQAADIVTQKLNAAPTDPASAQGRAEEALRRLERTSADINASWPDENRFHFQVLNLQPALVIKITVRTHASFLVFGIPQEYSGKSDLAQCGFR